MQMVRGACIRPRCLCHSIQVNPRVLPPIHVFHIFLVSLFLAHTNNSLFVSADLPRSLVVETGLGEGILESSETKLQKISVACKLLKSDSELRQKAEAKRRKSSKHKSHNTAGELAAKVLHIYVKQYMHLI